MMWISHASFGCFYSLFLFILSFESFCLAFAHVDFTVLFSGAPTLQVLSES